MSFSECFEIVRNKVKPERDKANRLSNKEKWWIYAEDRPGLYKSISNKNKVMGISQVTKYLVFSILEKGYVFDTSMIIFPIEEYSFFNILQSSIHEIWSRKYSSTLETRLRYTPTDAFETFPFPENLTFEKEQALEQIGLQYHDYRSKLMISMQLGLTKTYNTFHAKEIKPGITTLDLQSLDKKAIEKQYGKEVWNLWNHLQKTIGTCTIEEAITGIIKLRELHVQMDNAVLEAYGWGPSTGQAGSVGGAPSPSGRAGVGLSHDFYEVDYLPENDRIRYTIHPDARKEILKRLLELNHQIHEEEVKKGLWDKKKMGAYKKVVGKVNVVEEEGFEQGKLF